MGVLLLIFLILLLRKNSSTDLRRSDFGKVIRFGVIALIAINVLSALIASGGLTAITVISALIIGGLILANKVKQSQDQSRSGDCDRSVEGGQQYGQQYGSGQQGQGLFTPEDLAKMKDFFSKAGEQTKTSGRSYTGTTGAGTQARSSSGSGKGGRSNTGTARSSSTGSYWKTGSSTTYQADQKLKSKILPKSHDKRAKIIREFSEKYNLFLTEEQVKSICDASYMSLAWKMEVEAMCTKYDDVHEWFQGDTAFLRAYLHAFTIQYVSSDFAQQQINAMESFERIFQYNDEIADLSIPTRIEMINSKFFTAFDESTFMIAFRFLEACGRHHKLGGVNLNEKDAELDELLKKYVKSDEGETGTGSMS